MKAVVLGVTVADPLVTRSFSPPGPSAPVRSSRLAPPSVVQAACAVLVIGTSTGALRSTTAR